MAQTLINLSYKDFVAKAKSFGVKHLLVEITEDIPEEMRHTYAPMPGRDTIAGIYSDAADGVWFKIPKRWETNKRKFEKVII